MLPEKEAANLTRWDGRPGWYEVYYLKWNDPKSRTAYWVRYTLTSPTPGAGEPYGELWGIFFDAADPMKNFAAKERFPIGGLRLGRERFEVGIGDALLRQNKCNGRIEGQKGGPVLAWDLGFDSASPLFRHFPAAWMYKAKFPKTKVLSPHEFGRFRGKVTAGGREIEFEGAPGQQTHIWGTKHALRWAWGHCNLFKEDPEAIWEGLDSQIKLGPLISPHLNLFYLSTGGKDYLFNSLGCLLTNKSRWELGKWSFEAKNTEARLKGEITCRPEEVVAVTYQDPDGEKLWCHNSKVASIGLRLDRRDGTRIVELTSDHSSAAEFVDRVNYPEAPARI